MLRVSQSVRSDQVELQCFCPSCTCILREREGKVQKQFYLRSCELRKKLYAFPLKAIYTTFCNPATGTFAWVGAEHAEIIMLNDIRWKPSRLTCCSVQARVRSGYEISFSCLKGISFICSPRKIFQSETSSSPKIRHT